LDDNSEEFESEILSGSEEFDIYQNKSKKVHKLLAKSDEESQKLVLEPVEVNQRVNIPRQE